MIETLFWRPCDNCLRYSADCRLVRPVADDETKPPERSLRFCPKCRASRSDEYKLVDGRKEES